jgi:ABC-type multidrug transport system ATPase subunit
VKGYGIKRKGQARSDDLICLSPLSQGKSRGLKWKVTVAGTDIANQDKQDFFLVPNIKDIPGEIKVKNLFMLYKRLFKPTAEMTESVWAEIGKEKLAKKFSKLDDFDKGMVLLILARMVNTKIYILNDLLLGIPGNLWYELRDFVDALLKSDTIIIDIETTNNPWIRISSQKLIGYRDGKYEDINQIKNKP